MHINNPEALKNWLTMVLEPLCDADPAALARYVLALLKKDKPVKELKQCMQEQLDVFLSHETTPFLERLFDALKSEEYLAHAGPGDGTDTLDPATSFATLDNMTASTVEKSDRECTPPLSSNNNKAKEFDMSLSPVSSVQTSGGVISNASLVSPASTATTTTPIATSSQKRESPVKHGLSGKEDAHARENRRRARSRSRSFDRLRRSRSRERRMAEHNRDKNQHKYRNKSPPGGSLSGSAGERRRGPERRGIRRNRSQSGSRSRSMSPDRKRPSRSISPTLAASKKSQRCRDFDEKGYCMRGETCPWDHGVDPVVLEDLNNPALLNLPGTARPIMSAEYNPYAPDLWSRSANLRPAPLGAPFARHSGGPPGTNFSFMNQSSVQRELIPVPVVGDGNGAAPEGGSIPKRRFEGDDSTGMPEGMMKRKQTMAARLGPRVANQAQQQNCSLELRKIPRGLNQIAHLNNHFSKFGKIVNIQVSYEGDPEAAIVTFSTHAEANVAYRSTEAVLNNRFIKVFWHVPNSSNGDTTPKPDPSAMSLRRGFPNQYHINHKIATTTAAVGVTQQSSTTSVASVQSGPSDPVTGATATSSTSTSTVTVSSSGTITTTSASGGTTSISNKGMTLVNTAAGVAPPNVPIRITNPKLKREVAQLARKQKENAVQVASGLMKKKQTLLEGLIKQMSSTVMLMEKGDVTEAQKFVYISTIKELETKINALKKEISSEQQRLAQVQPTVPMRKTKEQKQKELLDVELDLITQEHEGNDPATIQRKLKELQKTIHAVAASKPRPRAVVPRGSTTTRLDRRPTTICVTGFELEDSDILLGHFKHFGEITKNSLDKDVPSLTISFATRLNAEQALQRGRNFKEKLLNISWVNQNGALPTTEAKTPSAAEPDLDQEKSTTAAPMLGVVDDEEEQEDEERSWRR